MVPPAQWKRYRTVNQRPPKLISIPVSRSSVEQISSSATPVSHSVIAIFQLPNTTPTAMSRVSTPPQTPTQTTHAVLNGLTTPQSSPGSDVLPKPRVVENFRPISVIIIGAGFSGIYCGIRIPERLRNVKLTIYEKNSGIGGTWYENRYPGCACDIPCKKPWSRWSSFLTVVAHSYQYTFAPNPNWSQSHAPGPEILQYLESVTKRYSVDRFIKTSHKVLDAAWDEKTSQW